MSHRECIVVNGPHKGKNVTVPNSADYLKLANGMEDIPCASCGGASGQREMNYTMYRRVGNNHEFEEST